MNDEYKGHLWAVSCVLVKNIPSGMSIANTLSWRSDCSENEARGAATKYAAETYPDHSINMVTVAKVLPEEETK